MEENNKYKRLKTRYKDVNVIYQNTGNFYHLRYVALETKDTLEAAIQSDNLNSN